MENNKSYGTVKTDEGDGIIGQVEIKDFIQSSFKDNRLITVATLADDTVVLLVENPISTGRATKSVMRLSPDSFSGLYSAILMYMACKNIDPIEFSKQSHKDNSVEYTYSDNLEPIAEK